MEAVAHFTPEAWIRDQAVEVDPQGPQEWVTKFEGLTDEQAHTILGYDRDGDYRSGLDRDDLLKDDPAAPEWVRLWRGPFTIRVRET